MNIYKKWLIVTFVHLLIFLAIISLSYKKLILPEMYKPTIFRLGHEINTLIVGASHSMCSFNPDIIDNSCNISVSAENFFYTYYKTKFILKNNPQLKNIVLSFSYSHISKNNEDKLFDSDASLNYFNKYFMLLDNQGKKNLRQFNQSYIVSVVKFDLGIPLGFIDDMNLILRLLLNKVELEEYSFWGSYYGSKNSNLKSNLIDAKINEYFYKNGEVVAASDIMVEYLEKIILLCKENKKKIILINTPVHKQYYKKIPPFYMRKYQEILTSFQKKYPEIIYYNFNQFKLEDKCYGDGDHLNKFGADIFSNKINGILHNTDK